MPKKKCAALLAVSVLAVFMFLPRVWAWDAKGFRTPESVLSDPATGYIYVSNINGSPTAKDGNGFISRLNSDGSIKELKFIRGGGAFTLDAPKGLALTGGLLYVADITHVRAFNLEDGTIVADINLKPLGASFLNDLVADAEGNLYVSDTATNSIFLIKTAAGNEISLFIRNKRLRGPNGLAIHPVTGDIIVASFSGGRLLKIKGGGVAQLEVGRRFENLDGVDFDSEGNIYFSDFGAGVVYKVGQDGKAVPVDKRLNSPADIFVDKVNNILLIPDFSANRVKAIPLK